MSGLDHRLEPSDGARRFEVINGALGRRRWSSDEKARILEETLAPGAIVSTIARRHGLTPQQLFTWRREARKAAEAAVTFAPVVVTPATRPPRPEPAALGEERKSPRRPARKRRGAAAIELEAGGVTVRVADGASAEAIAAVIRALKASA